MTIVSQIDLKPLLKSYIFANTPRYLYQHFRTNMSLKELAERNSVNDLISEYNSRANKEERSVEDVVIAYAVLISFTFLAYKNAIAAFANVDLTQLDWGSEIKDIFVSLFIPTNTFKFEIEAQPEISQVQRPLGKPISAITQQTIQISTEPNLSVNKTEE